jgi:Repeat of unknown function (DUF5648)
MKALYRFGCVTRCTLPFALSVVLAAQVNAAALPTCAISPETAASLPSETVAPVRVDSHGNFFSGVVVTPFSITELDRFGVTYWALRQFGEGYIGVRYVTTKVLEEKICASGNKIVFSERSRDEWPRDKWFEGITPKPYLHVREFVGTHLFQETPPRGVGLYFLSALGADSDFVFNGGAGQGFNTTSNSFRVPRDGEGMTAVHRFYGNSGNGLGAHFYTADDSEYASMLIAIANGANYHYEFVGFFAPRATRQSDGRFTCPSSGQTPVIRLHLAPTRTDDPFLYRYVTDPGLARAMQAKGWVNQGASFCALAD